VTDKVGRCARCHRVLKDPVSVDRGLGPVCYRKGDLQVTLPEQMDPFDESTRDISMRRTADGTPIFNIPQTHRHHSPTGMEYGYSGSGPADFALNIMAIFLPLNGEGVRLWDGSLVSAEAYELHQDFKQDFIATGPAAGGTLIGSAIQKWIDAKLEGHSDAASESSR
jgi:hypothetical protein